MNIEVSIGPETSRPISVSEKSEEALLPLLFFQLLQRHRAEDLYFSNLGGFHDVREDGTCAFSLYVRLDGQVAIPRDLLDDMRADFDPSETDDLDRLTREYIVDDLIEKRLTKALEEASRRADLPSVLSYDEEDCWFLHETLATEPEEHLQALLHRAFPTSDSMHA